VADALSVGLSVGIAAQAATGLHIARLDEATAALRP
jgi:hypothetical protein